MNVVGRDSAGGDTPAELEALRARMHSIARRRVSSAANHSVTSSFCFAGASFGTGFAPCCGAGAAGSGAAGSGAANG